MLRKKKDKFNWAIEEFDKKETDTKKPKHHDKFVTNYEGKSLKLTKREHSFFEKGRVKPKVSIKEPTLTNLNEKKGSNKFLEDVDLFRVEPRFFTRVERSSKNSCKSEVSKLKSLIQAVEEKHEKRRHKLRY